MAAALVGFCLALWVYWSHLKTDGQLYHSVEICSEDEAVTDRIPILHPIPAGQAATPAVYFDKTDHLFFHYHSKIKVWMFLFAILIGASFGFVLPTVYQGIALFRESGLSWWMLLPAVLLTGVTQLFSIAFAGGKWLQWLDGVAYYLSFTDLMLEFEVLLDEPRTAVMQLILLATTGAFFAIIGIFSVNFALARLDRLKDGREQARVFGLMSESLNFFLFVLAIIISGTTVTTAMGREALLQAIPTGNQFLLPSEFVYLYGAIFTLFLAIIYLPVYYQLKRKGELLWSALSEAEARNTAASSPEQPPSPAPEPEWEAVFNMQHSKFDTFKVIISILGPALTGILSKLVEL
ncbi:MAG: hypothetical protein AAGB22_05500 [Bacteroidota bacterium]